MIEYLVLAGTSAVLWIPILVRFFNAWRTRRNPVSLAICLFVILMLWELVARFWIITRKIEGTYLVYVFSGLEVFVAINFHLAFYWSAKRFPDTRGK